MKKNILLFCAMIGALFISCSKEDSNEISLSKSETTLNFGDEYQIDATSESDIFYTVDDEYHASITEAGLVTARFVGETDITLTNGDDEKIFKLTVAATTNIYPEPDVEYGTPKSTIIAEYGDPDGETDGAISYNDYSNKAPVILFSFDSNNKLTGYALLVKTAYSSDLGVFLAERYLLASDEELLFVNGLTDETATMVIGAELYNLSYWMVGYVLIDPATKSATIKGTRTIDVLEPVKRKIGELL